MIKKAGNPFKNAFLTSTIFILLLGFVGASAQNTVPKLTAEQWQADVRFLGEELPKRHRNAFHRMKREDFEREVKTLHDRVPTLSEDEIVVGLMKIVAKIKDGHTNIIPRPYFRSGIYPVKFYLFSDGLFIQRAAPEYAEMVGARVLKIGNLSTEEAFKTVSPAAFADNEMGVKNMAPALLSVPEVLAGLKVIDDKQKLNLLVETGGKQKTFEIKPAGTLDNLFQNPASWIDAAGKANAPLYLKDQQNLYWFEYDKDRKMVYVQHNGIANKTDEPVADFYKRVFAFVEANPVEKFVMDLRFNGGGNNGLNRQVVIDLIKSKINRRGKLFVITGRQTFSAAQNLVNQIEKYTEAIFVGEPTAAHPNHYGDNRPFTLPNSKLTVRASTLWWQDLDPRDERFWTAPEIAAEISSEDYRSGKDPVLQAALDYAPGTALSELIAAATMQKDLAEFVPKYKAFKANPKSKFVNSEAVMNTFGYTLLARQRVADAVEIFKLNAEAYPESANVYDSLGDAYEAAGRKEDAIKAYEKALSIDPNFPTSLENLRRLKGS
ncbi:MAG TPA: tetratricopeptide repeat protein [Pyrinomonadaceae bacterium]|jgi:tetratricopeptide (TPR) repeat protein